MIDSDNLIIMDLIRRYPVLEVCKTDIKNVCNILIDRFLEQKRLFVCGNGGSCADADHIVGELAKGFLKKRPLPEDQRKMLQTKVPDGALLAAKLQIGLPAISLHSQSALATAVANDLGEDLVYAQTLYAIGNKGDVLLGISTSGNARNVHLACQVAKLKGMDIIGLTGDKGGKLADIADICIKVPATETYQVQELHLPVYHAICAAVEADLFE